MMDIHDCLMRWIDQYPSRRSAWLEFGDNKGVSVCLHQEHNGVANAITVTLKNVSWCCWNQTAIEVAMMHLDDNAVNLERAMVKI